MAPPSENNALGRVYSFNGATLGAGPTVGTWIEGVARRITELGIGFGLWIEPEMVSAQSRLFEAHPDWAVGVPGRPRTESRQQLVLDLSRTEVVDHLFELVLADR